MKVQASIGWGFQAAGSGGSKRFDSSQVFSHYLTTTDHHAVTDLQKKSQVSLKCSGLGSRAHAERQRWKSKDTCLMSSTGAKAVCSES